MSEGYGYKQLLLVSHFQAIIDPGKTFDSYNVMDDSLGSAYPATLLKPPKAIFLGSAATQRSYIFKAGVMSIYTV